MNPLHHPDQPRCRKLKSIGFPEQRWGSLMANLETNEYWYEPTVMEMLDVIPFEMQVNKKKKRYETCTYIKNSFVLMHGDTLPNALADLIFWLVENGYLKF